MNTKKWIALCALGLTLTACGTPETIPIGNEPGDSSESVTFNFVEPSGNVKATWTLGEPQEIQWETTEVTEDFYLVLLLEGAVEGSIAVLDYDHMMLGKSKWDGHSIWMGDVGFPATEGTYNLVGRLYDGPVCFQSEACTYSEYGELITEDTVNVQLIKKDS